MVGWVPKPPIYYPTPGLSWSSELYPPIVPATYVVSSSTGDDPIPGDEKFLAAGEFPSESSEPDLT